MRRSRGFTLVELLVVTIIFGIVAAILSAIFIQSRRSKIVTELLTEAQQNVRIAVDLMAAEIRSAGYGVDWDLEQGAVVHAGPYDIVLNANLNPYPDTDPPSAPSAIDIEKSPDQVPPGVSDPLYQPEVTYLTGAETIRYTLDYDNDKDMDPDDRSAGWASRTRNPYDYLLIKQVYGYDASENSNGGENLGVALLRGPTPQWPSPADDVPALFEYWWDNDEDGNTPDSLYGDTDGDGQLSLSEIQNMGDSPVPNPERISRVTINGVGETKSPLPDGTYQQVRVSTTVSVMRNPNPHRYFLYGHVYHDQDEDGQFTTGEPGLEGFRVSIGAGLYDYTEGDSGWYEFSLVPGTFTVKASTNPGWDFTTPAETTIEIHTSDLYLTEDRHFGMRSVPTGYVAGYVFYDSIPEHDGDFDSLDGERGIEGVRVICPTQGNDTTTNEDGFYILEVNCQEDPHTLREIDLPGWLSTTTNDTFFYILEAAQGDTVPIHFGDVYFAGEGTVMVWVPNGGELYYAGDDTLIRWWASDSLDRIASASIYLSTDAGTVYDSITTVQNVGLLEPWHGSYRWVVPAAGSDECLIGVRVWDTASNSFWDESDSLFEIRVAGEERMYYFRNDTSGIYLGAGDTVRLLQHTFGDSSDSANCFTTGAKLDTFPLYYYASNPTEDDSAIWVTDSFPADTTIESGTWQFVLWGTVDTVYFFPTPLFHQLGVKVYRYRGGSPDSMLFELFQPEPGLTPVWQSVALDTFIAQSVSFDSADRVWVEVWTIRNTFAREDTLEVKFGYNGQTEYKSYFTTP